MSVYCCAAGALAAAGLEVSAVAGVCVGMSGVDRPADVDMVRDSLQAWLPVGVGLKHACVVERTWLACMSNEIGKHVNDKVTFNDAGGDPGLQ